MRKTIIEIEREKVISPLIVSIASPAGTDELKNMLDDRFAGYATGKISLISAEDSQKRIRALLGVEFN